MQTEEQSTEGLQEGTTGGELDGETGQSVAENQTTIDGPGNEAQTFFDPQEYETLASQLPEDIRGQVDAYKKSLQAGFTKKSQEFAANKHKIEAYDAFEKNPQQVIQQLAQQYGYQLMQGAQQPEDQNWEPQDWNEVTTRIKEQARQEVLKDLAPYLNEVKQLKESTTEQYLDSKYPDWRNYEDDMRQLMESHPTLAKDPDTLYRMALPGEVVQSRAYKAALKKVQSQTQGAKVSGQGTVNKQTSSEPDGPLSFDQAVKVAKSRIQKRLA